MRIVVDSRERLPYDFLSQGADIEPVKGKLEVGDYSIAGFENKVAVERKSLPDIEMCLSSERPRFERELRRAKMLEAFAVVIETDYQTLLEDIERRRYAQARRALSASQASASIQAFASRLGIAFFFTGNRENGEAFTAGFLKHYLRGKLYEYDALAKELDLKKAQADGGLYVS